MPGISNAGKKTPEAPYGTDTEYADPGYQNDGQKRYPIDTEAHCRAAWSYINQRKNAAKYTAEQVSAIKTRIRRAGKKFGIEFAENSVPQPVNGTLPQGVGWYQITARADAPHEITIYDEIGDWGVTAGQFVNDLAGLRGDEITLRLNSAGGEVFGGIAIYNALRNHPAKVTTYVDGLAASIASVIAMAGDHVEMSPNSTLMIHDAQSAAAGDAADLRQMAELLDKTSNNIASIYAEKTGGQASDWRELMQATTWYDAGEAVDAGLADAVTRRDGAPPAAVAALQPQPVLARADDTTQTNAADDDWFSAWNPDDFRRALKEASK